jgi:hypothetical protein
MNWLPKLPGRLPPSTLILLGVLVFVMLAIPVMNWLNARSQPIEEIETLPSRIATPKPLEALPIPFLVTQDPAPKSSSTPTPTTLPAKPTAKPSLPNPFVALPGQNPTPTPAPTPKPVAKPTANPIVKPAPPPTPKPVVKPTANPVVKPALPPTPKPVVKVSALEQFVTNNQLVLSGVTLGSVRVAIITSSLGSMVLTQGEYIPGSTVLVSRVESNKVILAQGKETAVLRLRDGE